MSGANCSYEPCPLDMCGECGERWPCAASSAAAEPIFCPEQTYRATRDSPAEFCENEVDDYGDLCPEHEEDDRSYELYDAWRDSKYDD